MSEVDDAIKRVAIRASGRTRHEGSDPWDEETLAAEIERLTDRHAALEAAHVQMQARLDAMAKERDNLLVQALGVEAERDIARQENERLRLWFQRIDNINDDPARFSTEIDQACIDALAGKPMTGAVNINQQSPNTEK